MIDISDTFLVFSGQANKELAHNIVRCMGTSLSKIRLDRFSDGEIQVELEQNVRNRDIFIIQSTCKPVNSHLMELLLIADALHRASARKITAVIPYIGYSRQDRRPHSTRSPISAKVVAKMLSNIGIHQILTVDLHATQIQGFFSIPVDNIYAAPLFLGDVWRNIKENENMIVVSPDVGGVVRARGISKMLGISDLAIIDKRRPSANTSEVMNVIGNVKDRSCLIVDDLVDTAGTLCKAADALKKQGANRVLAYCTHPVLSGNAVQNLKNSEIDELIVTDSIPLSKKAIKCDKIRQISISALLAETMNRMHTGESVASLYME